MPGVFPFRIVPRDSKIVLYGAGKLGREFYMQIHDTNWCEVLAWIDKGFSGCRLNKPFDCVENVNFYQADFFVVAVIDLQIGTQIKEWLLTKGIEEKKIIWSPGEYCKDYRVFPNNRELLLRDVDAYLELANLYFDSKSLFGGKYTSQYYESNLSLGLRGQRSTEERLSLYRVSYFLNRNHRVLDIGSNSGFLALQVASYVKEIVGCEIDEEQIRVAEFAKRLLEVNNARFICVDFRDFDAEVTFDAILLLAVHGHIISDGYSNYDFVKKIMDILSPGGYIFFESQYGVDRQYWELRQLFQKKGMTEVWHGNYTGLNGSEERDFTIYQNKNSD